MVVKRHNVYLVILSICFSAFCVSCKFSQKENETDDQSIVEKQEKTDPSFIQNSEWKEITTANSGIVLDIRYATTNNFTEKQIYDCPRCFMRPEIADKLIRLNKEIQHKYQYKLKVFDCYRPRPAQQKLWDIVPDSMYVAPPSKGSMHNRGIAIDLTLVNENGEELEMGTAYDFFGRAAHTDYFDLPKNILENRALLQDLMNSIGFKKIQSEWWHFSCEEQMYPLSDWEWPCQ